MKSTRNEVKRFGAVHVRSTSCVLSGCKSDSKLVAMNPERFFSLALPKYEEVEQMERIIEGVRESNNEHYKSLMAKFENKQNSSKSRSLLLSLSDSFTPEMVQCTNDDEVIDKYIQGIYEADKEEIIEWLNNVMRIDNLSLPCGLPSSLKMGKKYFKKCEAFRNFYVSSSDEVMLLDGEYISKLEEAEKKFDHLSQEIHNMTWSVEETALLYYAILYYDASSKTPRLILELCKRLFPQKAIQDIRDQKYRLKFRCVLEQRVKGILNSWIRDREELDKKIHSGWADLNKKFAQATARKIAFEEQNDISACLSYELTKLRKNKNSIVKALTIAKSSLQTIRDHIQKEKEAKEEARREKIKEKIQMYKVDKDKQLWRDIYKSKIEELEKKKKLREQIVQNNERINFRRGKEEEKKLSAEEKRKAKEAELEKRRETLEKMKEKVNLDYNPSNFLLQTYSSTSRKFDTSKVGVCEDDEKMIKFFSERYSFSADTIWGDRRVKLESKLRDAGLIESNYARQVLDAMQKAPPSHLSSQIKFNDNDS